MQEKYARILQQRKAKRRVGVAVMAVAVTIVAAAALLGWNALAFGGERGLPEATKSQAAWYNTNDAGTQRHAGSTFEVPADEDADPEVSGAAITLDEYSLDPADLLALPHTDAPETFNLSEGGQPVQLDDSQLKPVADAVEAIRENGDCGFVFLDVDTGHGIMCDADQESYIASSAKAVLAYYALQNGAGERDYTRRNIESAIVHSSNDAFENFGYTYFTSDYIGWLADRGVEHTLYSGNLYPDMSARSLASIWAEILLYIYDGSDDAAWFADLLGSTSVSFIRDAVQDTGATVMNKAGWISDYDVDSVTDASVIQLEDRTYLMVIVTGQPDWSIAEDNVRDLAAALFDLRMDM